MPRAKKWKSDELKLLAAAWIRATNDAERGADQRLGTFQETMLEKLKELSPAECPDGYYWKRGAVACQEYFRDKVSPDVQSFNKALKQVYDSEPTGCGQNEVIAMAVAIHMKKANKMDYHFKLFAVESWRNFGAWELLKCIPKFALGQDSDSAGVDITTEDEDRDDVAAVPVAEAADEDDSDDAVVVVPVVNRASRGGSGRDASKRAKYRKKKQQEIEKEHLENTKKRTQYQANADKSLKRLVVQGQMRLAQQASANEYIILSLFAERCSKNEESRDYDIVYAEMRRRAVGLVGAGVTVDPPAVEEPAPPAPAAGEAVANADDEDEQYVLALLDDEER